MKKFIPILLAGALVLGGCNFGQQQNNETSMPTEKPAEKMQQEAIVNGNYKLDVHKSILGWSATRIAGKPHTGRVELIKGSLLAKDGAFHSGEASIDMTKITEDKNNERFLGHIRSADFFEVEKFPTSKIAIKEIISIDGGGARIIADLTIKDQTNEIEFVADMNYADRTLRAQADFDIDRTKWNIIYDSGNFVKDLGDKAIKDEITYSLDIYFNHDQKDEVVKSKAKETMNGKWITYGEDRRGYLVKPKASGTFPGVVMIHEWWGLNQNIKNSAHELAEEGYVVLAVDLYDGKVAEKSEDARKYATAVREDLEGAVAHMKDAVAYLKTEKASTGSVASMGWCFGGQMSLQLSLKEDLDATVIYYGSLETDKEKLASLNSPVLGVFGETDKSITVASVNEFDSALDELGIENDIHIYSGVGHAFANPSNPGHDEAKAEDAWMKTVEFLNGNLKGD